MRRTLLRLITAVQLTRLTIAFGAVSDLWFIILLTRAGARGDLPEALRPLPAAEIVRLDLPAALIAGAVIAVGLFAYGASLNDVLDVRHDSAFSPERPIPAGRIKVGQAVVVAVGSLMVAVLGAVWIGTWAVCLTLLTATGLLFYNATGKYIPAVGAITIGLIHATHMFIPNHALAFTLPVWLVMTHSIAIAVVVHVLEEKRPRFERRELIATLVGWSFWSIVVLGISMVGDRRLWPAEVPLTGLIYPAVTVVCFIFVATWKARRVSARAGAEKVRRYGAMWQSLYGAAWLLAVGLYAEALWIGAFALVGFAAMTLIKEVTGFTGRPVSYRLH